MTATYLADFKQLVLNPRAFFEKVKHDKDEQKPIRLLILSGLIYLVLTSISALLFFSFFGSDVALIAQPLLSGERGTVFEKVVLTWFWIIFNIFSTLIQIPLFHWLLVKIGSKKGKVDTVKFIIYPTVFTFLLMWVPFVGVLWLIYGIYAQYLASKILLGFNFTHFFQSILVMILVATVTVWVWDVLENIIVTLLGFGVV